MLTFVSIYRLMMPNLLLVLMASMVGFLWAATVKPSAPGPPVTKTRIHYIEVDYEEETPQPSRNSGLPRLTTADFSPKKCDYDPCVVQDVPCSVLSAQTKCYCPGLTGPHQLPEPPRLREVKQGSSGEVEVHWCAPFSTVKHYKLVREGGQILGSLFGELSRNGTLKGLEAGTRVCVVAVNDAGDSEIGERSCALFVPHNTSQVALISGIVVGCVCVLLLLLLAALLLWRRKYWRKNGPSGGEGLRNPSYSTAEAL